MKLVNFKLIALFVVSYSLALIAFTPLSWLMPMVEPKLNAQAISTSAVHGNIWRGQAIVRSRYVSEVNLSWRLKPAGMLLFKLPIELSVTSNDMDLHGLVSLSPFSVSVADLSGYLDERAALPIYSRYGVKISGRLQLDAVSADMSWSQKLGDASGSMSWSGGPLSLPVGRSTQNYEVPTMFGELSSDETQWLVSVLGSKQQEYIRANLTREGMGTLSVKRQLATEMNIPVPGNGSSLIDISQQVLNGQ